MWGGEGGGGGGGGLGEGFLRLLPQHDDVFFGSTPLHLCFLKRMERPLSQINLLSVAHSAGTRKS